MRHACGYYLVNQGYNTREIQDFLGHRDIKHTEKYTKLNARRSSILIGGICDIERVGA
ncbi:tyrosine-type recombinase/integrase [Nostoc sphaeroides]|uniref:Type 1 fimbriae regulatory protein n=1 Tax=Nostoc sphaeroides CCNUC1 TaxID=2653204 RepID=A0A5P8WIW6_9NOSO|nr:tyrosine-type recombinase/integrase [Nostoc sphaeroides]QFS52785.1 type 1 fimbriae regulatory protein [Nostoc sphaeroides CCNUC1]